MHDDDLSFAPHDPPPEPASRGRIVATAVSAVIFGVLGALAGAGFGIVPAILGGSIGAILGGLGAFAFAIGRRWIGGGVLAVALCSSTCCGLSGLAFRGLQSMVPDTVALEALEAPGRTYYRHPSLGFLVGAPGERFVDMSTSPLASVTALATRSLGTPEGAWVWVSPSHGAQVFAFAARLAAEPELATTRAFMRGFARSTLRRESVVDDPPFEQWTELEHDVWVRAAGADANGPLSTSARYRAWRDAEGTWHALIVAAKSHPDDQWTDFLLDLHTPGEPWRGPGVAPAGFAPRATTLDAARASLETTLLREVRNPDPPMLAEGETTFELTRYTSPAGSLTAYVTPNARSAQRRPAVLWLHGGFTLDPTDIEPGWAPRALADAGLVVMLPATRGESASDGRIELLLGEVDDVRAALDALRALPGVDPEHVVVMGHSVGGALALLLAETGAPARAYVAFGPPADAFWMNERGPDDEGRVFDPRRVEELWARSPVAFLASITAPTWIIEGATESLAHDARTLAAAAPPDAPIRVIVPSGGDHRSLVAPVTALLAPRIFAREPLALEPAEVESIAREQ